MERSKIQANSHDKMFNYLLNQNKSILKLFQNKVFDIKKYEISFSDDFDDLVGNFLFSKKYICRRGIVYLLNPLNAAF